MRRDGPAPAWPARPEHAAAWLAAIVESSDDAIVSKDLNGVITTWNAGAERLFGYTAEEAVGRSVTMLIPPGRLDEESAILARLRRGQRIDHYETVRRRKDGTLVDVSLTVSPIVDARGVVGGASKIARDVTDRKQADARAAREQEATSRLYDIGIRCISPGAMLADCLGEVLDTAMWITGASRGLVQLLDPASGASAIVAQRGFDDAFLAQFGRLAHDDAAMLVSGRRIVVEDVTASELFAERPALARLRDAGVRAVQATPLVCSGGGVLGIVATYFAEPHRPSARDGQLLDVLARQAADYVERTHGEQQREKLLRATEAARREAEAASRAKDEFLAMLGHELRNPLSAVRNAVATALLDEGSRDRALEIARRQTDQLGRIVDDLLDVARITRGHVVLRKARVALGEVLGRSVEGARALMDERGHALTLSLPSAPIHLDADAARLEQAVANVLSNAAKYTDPGGTVHVTAERDGEAAIVRVRDNGVGIAPEVLPRIFDLFAQGDRALDRAQGGLGIGLTLVRRIVELHGGTVDAHSPGVGGGVEVVMRLPAIASGDGRDVGQAEPERSGHGRDRRPARVLLVEDNPDVAESLGMILEFFGHHVRMVHDGMAALATARANAPDVMLIDIGLPGMDGYAVARVIREDPSLKDVVLVALTGYGRPEDKDRALEAGFDHHLAKPVDLDALGQLVGRIGTPAAAQLRNSGTTRH